MLHTIQPKTTSKERKRVGRGGKRGTYSGRGMKGQKSRSGSSKRPAERDYIIRLPKRRGFKNKPLAPKPVVANLSDINAVFREGEVVTPRELVSRGVVASRQSEPGFIRAKILGNGNITKKLTVRGVAMSVSARDKVVKAGGSVE